MQKDSLRELYIDELRDLYNAETQLVRALPKMAKASANDQLRKAFEEHLRQTSDHVSRLERIFEQLEEKPSGKKCLGMVGLVKESRESPRSSQIEKAINHSRWRRLKGKAIARHGKLYINLLGELGKLLPINWGYTVWWRSKDRLTVRRVQRGSEFSPNGLQKRGDPY